MALSPFRGFSDAQSEVDRLFNEMVGDLFSGRRGRSAAPRVWSPPMEAYANNGDLVLRFDLPGVSLEDVDITLENHTLTVSGVRKAVAEEAPHLLLELPYGEFRRSVTVPEGSDADSIKATYKDGVLEIVLPGATAKIEPKRIAIETA
jgi:HSP20 family protein